MGLKLNCGCAGNLLPRPWINVDTTEPRNFLLTGGSANWRESCDFVQSDIRNLSWIGPEEVDEIRADFVLEHLHIDHEVPDTLYEWCRVLVRGGVINAMVPDAEYYAEAIKRFCRRNDLGGWMKFRTATFELLNPLGSGILGEGGRSAHKSLWTASSARLLFEAQGFKVDTETETEDKQGIRTLIIRAEKTLTPAGWRPRSTQSGGETDALGCRLG